MATVTDSLMPMQELLAFNQHRATEEWIQFPTSQLNRAATRSLEKTFGETTIVGPNQLNIPVWHWPAR
jgi:hypothetical protein